MHIIYNNLKGIFLFNFYCYGIRNNCLDIYGDGWGYEFFNFGYGEGYSNGDGEGDDFGYGDAISCGNGNSIGDGEIYDKGLIFEKDY